MHEDIKDPAKKDRLNQLYNQIYLNRFGKYTCLPVGIPVFADGLIRDDFGGILAVGGALVLAIGAGCAIHEHILSSKYRDLLRQYTKEQ